MSKNKNKIENIYYIFKARVTLVLSCDPITRVYKDTTNPTTKASLSRPKKKSKHHIAASEIERHS
jgi:hypothetical protein